MSKLKKIEDRTYWFIDAYNKLQEDGRLPSNVELAEIMGMKSKSTVTNILKKEQNIQPNQWEKFSVHFSLDKSPNGSHKNEREPTAMELLAGLTEGFKAIAATMRSIENKMAQEGTQAKVLDKVKAVEASLKSVLESQDAGFGLVAEVVLMEVHREANGNQKREKENLHRIRQKIGPKLGSIAQKGISPD